MRKRSRLIVEQTVRRGTIENYYNLVDFYMKLFDSSKRQLYWKWCLPQRKTWKIKQTPTLHNFLIIYLIVEIWIEMISDIDHVFCNIFLDSIKNVRIVTNTIIGSSFIHVRRHDNWLAFEHRLYKLSFIGHRVLPAIGLHTSRWENWKNQSCLRDDDPRSFV